MRITVEKWATFTADAHMIPWGYKSAMLRVDSKANDVPHEITDYLATTWWSPRHRSRSPSPSRYLLPQC